MIEMEPARILLTGAGGFVGRLLIPVLSQAFPSAHVTALLREAPLNGSSAVSTGVTYKKFDLLSDDMSALVSETAPDVVVHLAAISSVQQSLGTGGTAFDENLTAGLMLIRALNEQAPNAAVVYASSGEVYGRSFLNAPIANELTPVFPNNPYARSKLALEYAFQDMFCGKGRAVALRLFNHFGVGQDERFALASFAAQCRAVKAGLQTSIRVGNLAAKRDFLPVADILPAYISAIKYVLASANGSFDVFNIASGVPRSIESVLADLIKFSGISVKTEEDASRMRPAEIEIAAGNSHKFTDATAWQPQANWDDALRALVTEQ